MVNAGTKRSNEEITEDEPMSAGFLLFKEQKEGIIRNEWKTLSHRQKEVRILMIYRVLHLNSPH
jgi:hypothetical protein